MTSDEEDGSLHGPNCDCSDSSSLSSLESFSADIDVDSGGSNTWIISSPLNIGSGSSVHWSNSSVQDGNPDDRVYDLEFEVASVSESELNQNPIEDANSSSGLDERIDLHLQMLSTIGGSTVEEEKDGDADNSAEEESNSVKSEKSEHGLSSDSELSDQDKWPCHQCKTMTNAISRYCLRCFRTRRNWLPKRPKSRKANAKRRKMDNSVAIPHSSDDSTDDEEQVPANNQFFNLPDRVTVVQSSVTSSIQESNSCNIKSVLVTDFDDVPSSATSGLLPSSFQDNTPPTSNPNSQLSFLSHSSDGSLLKSESFTTPKSVVQLNTKLHTISASQSKESVLKGLESVTTNNDSSTNDNNSLKEQERSPSPSPTKSPLATDSASQPSNTQSKNIKAIPETSVCTVCCLREKDAAFVHNKIAHHCCCFSCADKILKKTGKCPICRERILRVVKIISV